MLLLAININRKNEKKTKNPCKNASLCHKMIMNNKLQKK